MIELSGDSLKNYTMGETFSTTSQISSYTQESISSFQIEQAGQSQQPFNLGELKLVKMFATVRDNDSKQYTLYMLSSNQD